MDRSSSGFRAILPAPTPAASRGMSSPGPSSESGGSAGTGSSGSGSGGGAGRGGVGGAGAGAGAGVPISHKRRRHVPAACTSCRKRKIKCTAERPKCRQCLRLAVDCIYDTVGSETLGEARHRRLGELQSRSSHYEELFNIIKTRPDPDVAAIVARIRQGARVDEVVRFVKEGDILIELSVAPETKYTYTFPFSQRMPSILLSSPAIPYMESLLARGTLDNRDSSSFPPPSSIAHDPDSVGQLDIDLETWNMYQTPYHAVELVDPRISSIKASKWTTVTADDAVVQKLMQIYFLSDFPYYTYLHKDHFLEDMVEGRDRYCSSLLVNTILAQACRGYQALPQRFNFWEPHTLRNRFLSEARRLWDLEAGQVHITTIQAAAILTLISSLDTLDVVSDRYLKEGIAMAQTLGIFDSYDSIHSRRRRNVYTITAWGLYGLQGVMNYHYRRQTTQNTPPREPLPSYADASAVFGDLFVRYPRSQIPVSCYHGEVARAAAEFRMVMVEIARRCFGPDASANGEITLQDAIYYREQFQGWYANLPRPLTAYRVILPAQLGLHLHYHNVLVNIFFSPTATKQASVGILESGQMNAYQSPGQIIASSKACIEALVRLYYLRHGFGGFDSTSCQFQWIMGEAAAEALARSNAADNNSNATREELLSTLVLGAVGLHESGRFSFIAQGLLQVLKSKLSSQEQLPLGRFLADETLGIDMQETTERYNQSNLPVNLFSMKLEPEQTLKKSLTIVSTPFRSPVDVDDSHDEMSAPSST